MFQTVPARPNDPHPPQGGEEQFREERLPTARPSPEQLREAKKQVKEMLDGMSGLPAFDIGIAGSPERGLIIRVRFYGQIGAGCELPKSANGVSIDYSEGQKPASPREPGKSPE